MAKNQNYRRAFYTNSYPSVRPSCSNYHALLSGKWIASARYVRNNLTKTTNRKRHQREFVARKYMSVGVGGLIITKDRSGRQNTAKLLVNARRITAYQMVEAKKSRRHFNYIFSNNHWLNRQHLRLNEPPTKTLGE